MGLVICGAKYVLVHLLQSKAVLFCFALRNMSVDQCSLLTTFLLDSFWFGYGYCSCTVLSTMLSLSTGVNIKSVFQVTEISL